MIAIIDYGVGNLFSLKSSFAHIGEEAVVTSDRKVLSEASGIILPGVGAFADAISKLNDSGMGEALKDELRKGKPAMGICLGMQLLFDESLEYGRYEGLKLIPGTVRSINDVTDGSLKIPHMGWNALHIVKEDCPVLKYTKEGDHVYFVHSYFADDCAPYVTSTAEYGVSITASVQKDNLFGCQFHPEKSGEVGLKILKAFCELG
ncbi:MAG: imidazole glycerol phosphate synthase subunit HisH [Lachnospiraceae bacterium]|nr:imidazole glycerol phosphate synthase subunit HisH [Lachnospiraceae bacterium]